MKADLHVHSTFSDSTRSPEEIAAVAKVKNVGLISVCDHATIEAYDRLSDACGKNNIKCILGVELSGTWRDESLHMLAYNFDRDNDEMKSLIRRHQSEMECEYIVYNMSLE